LDVKLFLKPVLGDCKGYLGEIGMLVEVQGERLVGGLGWMLGGVKELDVYWREGRIFLP